MNCAEDLFHTSIHTRRLTPAVFETHDSTMKRENERRIKELKGQEAAVFFRCAQDSQPETGNTTESERAGEGETQMKRQ